jgi:hypothetical protein
MALHEFSKLAPEIYLYTPPNAETGHLIILGTWLGAADKYIVKYVELHKKQIPTASILLLKSQVNSMVSSYSSQQKAIEPAMLPVLSLLEQCQQSKVAPRILLHIFSNGGINSAINLFTDLQRERKQALPLIGIICDSVPTGAGYRKTYNAFMYSFPSRFPTSILASTMVHTLLILLFLSVALGRYENPEDFWRTSILDTKLLESKRICYVASKVDKQTDWRDVVAHAEIARTRGWEVKEVITEDTPHCNHMKKDPQMYRDVVALMWERSKM